MGVRTRGLDIKAGAAKLKAERVARLEAELVIDRWNRRLATGRDMLWSPPGCSPGTHFAKMFVSVIRPGVQARCGRKGNSHWAAELACALFGSWRRTLRR